MRYVLDASVTLTWVFEDEATPATDALLDEVTLDGAAVPPLWFIECANALVLAERRGRIDGARAASAVDLLLRLPVRVNDERPNRALGVVLDLARTHGLSAYDATYLDLAVRTGLHLATGDGRLRVAAGAMGIAVHP